MTQKSANKKLSANQKAVLRVWRKYPNEKVVTVESGYFLTGGHGINIAKNTYWALKRSGLIDYHDYLSDLGKTIELD